MAGQPKVPNLAQGDSSWAEMVARLRRGGPLPRHIAIIMDGNGRWAHRRGLPRIAGHRASVAAIRDVVEASAELGLEVLTLYAFSTENWKRPPAEIQALMRLLVEFTQRELATLHKHGVRIRSIGHVEAFDDDAVQAMMAAERQTRGNTGLQLVLALNYGGRHELVDAAQALALRVEAGILRPDEITAEVFARQLYTKDLPDPDLIIRTSGEMRLSNFLLWQIAYAEFWVTDVWWPDFRRDHLAAAIASYQGRERRFGAVGTEGGGSHSC